MSNGQHHDEIELFPGDDWLINGTLTNEDGGPLDQTSASYEWALLDPDGVMVESAPGIAIAAVEPAATSGKCTITVPDTFTAELHSGRYHDVLRVHDSASQRSTLWTGPIAVAFNSFGATP